MPLDASRNSLVLPILELLGERPAHAYDLGTRLRERHAQLTPTRSTVTTLLKFLHRAGLVAAREPGRVGNRPPRTVYELTDRGAADFRARVESGLRDTPVASVDFALAVACLGALPAERAVALLSARAERLTREQEARPAGSTDMAELHTLPDGYWHGLVAAELAWIAALLARIRSAELAWAAGHPVAVPTPTAA
ncbi:PadR family transcriptional regulator [Actinoplanes sp. SE50]|uniref:PadR family transcriptional regulator n=1 Tax=unclassified Actinoplanes TaxID=2626549 RepID=UPI00023ECFC4|nr:MULTISPECIES: helix-turn-helix transcriptional regulator [unclassified Actinoplanes]AEV82132.1 transcriptional regulator, PadR-like family [Actinoplanes sp. SE50/110]ATO80531.1 PadR family transcriptional regulator [Actinoplanes sp. SE50]SLL97937.1 PadR family transcriptional regulator [Actinoplanes sp. SE50/110]